jgi:hypothetical protein
MIAVIIGVALASGLFVLGRLTSSTDETRADGCAAGQSAGYYKGLRQGESRGVQEGRALQLTEALPKDSRDAARAAFNTGYTAGANDAFGGYDGGWYVSAPYLITLVKGSGPITYDISSRTMLHEDIDYYLCPHMHTVCQRPHR